MKKEDVQKLEHGVYRIYWRDDAGGGSSVGVVGSLCNGDLYLICSNWTSDSSDRIVPHGDNKRTYWNDVERVELISNQKGDKGSLPECLRIINERRGQPRVDDNAREDSRTLTELVYEEERELIRAATSILTMTSSITGVYVEAALYLSNKFKEFNDVESD